MPNKGVNENQPLSRAEASVTRPKADLRPCTSPALNGSGLQSKPQVPSDSWEEQQRTTRSNTTIRQHMSVSWVISRISASDLNGQTVEFRVPGQYCAVQGV